ncbi:hypothetical protein [Pontibacter pudoricolor]|uniref:hypothetical protein n=1 Tax=Pontibacter pudoricolor TaxID=2694930 RepID=UPI001391B7B8|nr:hypothetical protein [Pontibacter pudoricolor]
MSSRNNLISTVLGISILLAILSGYIFSNKHYYLYHPERGKSEISKELYETNKKSTQFFKKESEFNLEAALICGALVIAAGFLISGLNLMKIVKETRSKTTSLTPAEQYEQFFGQPYKEE